MPKNYQTLTHADPHENRILRGRIREVGLNQMQADEAVLFGDAVHPLHEVRPVGCWAPKDTPVAVQQTSGRDRLNVHGSGISLGHPVGATGGRILATLLREMDRRGASLGLETMCIGGGQGLTAIFEAVE